jgi:hypothetical protein
LDDTVSLPETYRWFSLIACAGRVRRLTVLVGGAADPVDLTAAGANGFAANGAAADRSPIARAVSRARLVILRAVAG